jgi:hypothetical protein
MNSTIDDGFKYLLSKKYQESVLVEQVLTEMQEQISSLVTLQIHNQKLEITPTKKVLDKNANCNYHEDLVLTVKQYISFKSLENASFINTLSKRAAQYYRLAKQSDPLTNRRNQVIYKGSDILYLDEALKSILDLD